MGKDTKNFQGTSIALSMMVVVAVLLMGGFLIDLFLSKPIPTVPIPTVENIILIKHRDSSVVTGTIVRAPESIDKEGLIGITVVKLDSSTSGNRENGLDLFGALVSMSKNLSIGDKVSVNYLHIYERPRDGYLHIRIAEKL